MTVADDAHSLSPDAPDATSPARRLLSESLAYALVEAGQNVLALLVVPASLFWLTPADMGAVTLGQLGTIVMFTIGALGFDFAVVRSYLKWPDAGRVPRIHRLIVIVTTWSTALTLLAGVGWLLAGRRPWATVAWLAIAAGAGLAVRSLPLSLFRVTSQFRPYAIVAIGGSVLQAVLQIALLVAGYGLNGYLSGIAVAACVSAAVACRLVPHAPPASEPHMLDAALLRVAGAGLVSALSDRLVSNADRLALSAWASMDALGVYGTATRMSVPLRMVSGATSLALAPALSREEGRGRIAEVSAAIVAPFVTLLALLGALLQLFSWSFWLTPWRHVLGDFQPLLSVLVLSQLLASVVVIGQLLLYYLERPMQAGALAGMNAVITIAGLTWLVPRYGAAGAATVQLLASLYALAAVTLVTRRLGWVRGRVIAVLGVSAGVTSAVWFTTPLVGAVVTLVGAVLLARWAWHDLDHGRALRRLIPASARPRSVL